MAPDLPGSVLGHTGTPHPRAPRVELNARFVRALTTALSIPTSCVHGWSVGAAVAMRYAADCPDRVAGVVLANPPLPITLTPAERLVSQTLGRLAVAVGSALLRVLIRLWGRTLIDTKLAYLQGRPVPEQFAGLGGDLSRIPSDTLAVWTEELAGLRSHPETLGYAATALASVVSGIVVDQRAVRDAIDRISAPVLLLWGEDDPLVTARGRPNMLLLVATGTLLTWLHVTAVPAAFVLFACPWRALRRPVTQETVSAHG